MSRKQYGLMLVVFVIIAGCANPGIVQISPDTYLLSRTDRAGIFGNASAMKAEVIEEVNAFARSQGKVAIPTSIREVPMQIGRFASFDYQFRLVDPASSEEQSTSPVPRPDVVKEQTNKSTVDVRTKDDSAKSRDVYTPSTLLTKANYWAVIIGITKYKYSDQNGLTNLIFADDDAKAFTRALRNLDWSESNIKLLINEEATQRNILIALESWLTKAGPNDQIVLFWAGHGFPDPEDPEKVYFACYDTDISIPATGYRMDRVRAALEERKCKNVVLFADTCHAGKLITRGERGISVIPHIEKMRDEQKFPKGWIFMVGADTDRQAIEHSSWTNGAFTHCLINGLSGKADGYESVGPKDGIVTMRELRSYLNTAMPEETQRVLGVAKRPLITTSTGDPEIWNLTLQVK